MAERNPPTEEGDVSESTNAAYCLIADADNVVVPALTRRDFAEISEGKDVLEIEYQPEEGLAGANGDLRAAESGGRRGWSTHVKDRRCTRAAVWPPNSHFLHSESSTSLGKGRNIR